MPRGIPLAIMARLEQVPGMQPGRGVRNLAVGACYLGIIVGVLLAGATYGGFVDSGSGPGAADDEPEPASADGPAESTDNATASDEEQNLTEGEIVILFETTLERRGIDLISAERDGDVFRVEYYRTATTRTAVLENAGAISGAYVGAVGEGLETERMEVTARNEADDSPVLSWHVDSEWADAYHEGELTMDEVIQRSLVTADEVDADDAAEATGSADGDGDAELEGDEPASEGDGRDDQTEGTTDGNETTGADGETGDGDADTEDGDASTEDGDAAAEGGA